MSIDENKKLVEEILTQVKLINEILTSMEIKQGIKKEKPKPNLKVLQGGLCENT